MKTILLIEDNEAIRSNTAEILEISNYKVFTAADGKTGVETAFKEQPDLIICDIMMPNLDGFSVLHMLRKNEATEQTPFIFLTAKTDRNDFRKGMELGADDYLTKPFTGAELLSAIEGRIKKAAFNPKEPTIDEDPASKRDLLQELKNSSNLNHYKKKQIIFSEGNRPTSLFYIRKGKVKVFMTNENGKSLVVDLYNEGDFLGHVAILENTNYKETAEAIEDTELAYVPRKDFEQMMQSNQQLKATFLQLLANNISRKESQLLGLAYNSLRKKIANALLLIYRKYNGDNKKDFLIDITRANLAAIAGTATESLIRTLSEFKDEKLIEIKNGDISILDDIKLENIAN